jgi:hypothetical protein
MKFWVGTTDPDWFRYLSIRSFDEVNFWQPTAGVPFKTSDQPLAVLPDDPASGPDPDLLDWHMHNVFQH